MSNIAIGGSHSSEGQRLSQTGLDRDYRRCQTCASYGWFGRDAPYRHKCLPQFFVWIEESNPVDSPIVVYASTASEAAEAAVREFDNASGDYDVASGQESKKVRVLNLEQEKVRQEIWENLEDLTAQINQAEQGGQQNSPPPGQGAWEASKDLEILKSKRKAAVESIVKHLDSGQVFEVEGAMVPQYWVKPSGSQTKS